MEEKSIWADRVYDECSAETHNDPRKCYFGWWNRSEGWDSRVYFPKHQTRKTGSLNHSANPDSGSLTNPLRHDNYR